MVGRLLDRLHLTVFGLLVVFRAGRPISGERGLPHSSIPTSRNSSRVDASLRVDLRDGRRGSSTTEVQSGTLGNSSASFRSI